MAGGRTVDGPRALQAPLEAARADAVLPGLLPTAVGHV